MYIKILQCFLKSVLFSFGGGYTYVSMVREKLVDAEKLIDERTFNNILNWAQIIPGPVVFNFSMILSYHVGGIKLAVVSLPLILFPPLAVVFFLSRYLLQSEVFIIFLKGVMVCVPILIINIVIGIAKTFKKDLFRYLYAVMAFFLFYAGSSDLIFPMILLSVIVSILHYRIKNNRECDNDSA